MIWYTPQTKFRVLRNLFLCMYFCSCIGTTTKQNFSMDFDENLHTGSTSYIDVYDVLQSHSK